MRPMRPISLDSLRSRRLARAAGFLVVFGGAWFALDRLAVVPPMPGPAAVALAVALVVLAVGEMIVDRATPGLLVARLGYGRPATVGVVTALIVGGAVVASYLVGAAALGVTLELRPEWPLVLAGALLFHGLAEESVWRGFAFRHLREGRTFRRAVIYSIPLIALTHVPMIAASGWLVGGLATLTAAATCVPLAYLWERGGRTVWAPAIVHGLIGTWQIFERSYPMSYSMVVLLATIIVPFLAFPVAGWLTGRRRETAGVPAMGSSSAA